MKFGLCYDFRNPPGVGGKQRSTAGLYAATLDQIALVDTLGFDDIWLSEHHFVDDEYLPSPLAVAAAVAARTKRVRIGTIVLLVPFYHPIRLAEDCAVVDNLSGGRFVLGTGLGYRVEEFATFGVERKHRTSLTYEALDVVVKCWTEDEFSHEGRHFRFDRVRCAPKPVQKPRIPIWIGAMSPAAIRRAGRLSDGLIAPAWDVRKLYMQALKDAGREDWQRPRIASSGRWTFITDDPGRDWEILKPFALYQYREYAKWQTAAGEGALGDPPKTYADLERLNWYLVGTPDQIVKSIRETYDASPFERWWNLAMWPGVDVEMATRSIELFAQKVMPALRDLPE